MKKLYVALLSTSVLSLASAAQAADVAVIAPDWTGFYVGVGAGGGFAFADMTAVGGGEYYDYLYTEDYEFDLDMGYDPESNDYFYSPSSPNFSGLLTCDADQDYCEGGTGVLAGLTDDSGKAGFLGRGEIGFDYQVDRFVMGVNGSFTFGSRNMSSSASADGGGSVYTSEFEVRADDDDSIDSVDEMSGGGGGIGVTESELDLGNSWSVGARLGYLITDSTLLFAAGGYTQAKAELKASFDGNSGAGVSEYDDVSIDGAYNIKASNDDWLGGYYVGGGVETLLTDNFSLKFEYRYTDLGSIKASAEDSFSDGDCEVEDCWGYGTGVKAEADIVDHSVMATISFRM